MPYFIKCSFTYKVIASFLNAFYISYSKSKFKNFVDAASNAYKCSRFHMGIERYVSKKPAFLNSLFYKFILLIVRLIDKIMDLIHKPLAFIINTSEIKAEAEQEIKNGTEREKLALIGVFAASANIGFFGGSVILNKVDTAVNIVFFILAITALLCSFLSTRVYIIKNSTVYRMVKYLLQ